MELIPVTDPRFAPFGRVTGGDFKQLLDVLRDKTPCPKDGVVYVASEEALEQLPTTEWLSAHLYGGMPIQVGYCNGTNGVLNCLEYHRGCEINIAADDVVLLLGLRSDMEGWSLDTAKVRAFLVPKGTAVLLYETTLHYAPCGAPSDTGFRVVIVLPKGTNLDKPALTGAEDGEDALLWASNKWLLAHPDAPEAAQGAFVGLKGENLQL